MKVYVLVVLCGCGWFGNSSLLRNGAEILRFVLQSNFIRATISIKNNVILWVWPRCLHLEASMLKKLDCLLLAIFTISLKKYCPQKGTIVLLLYLYDWDVSFLCVVNLWGQEHQAKNNYSYKTNFKSWVKKRVINCCFLSKSI